MPRATTKPGFAVAMGLLVMTQTLACAEKSTRLTQAEREMAKQIVSKEAPKPKHRVDFRFGDEVRLIGYDLSTDTVVENKPFEVTWYWKVEKPLGEGWKTFTHLADANRVSRINMDSARVARRVYPAEKWKAGEYIKDKQEMTLPKDWDSDAVIFFLGFWNGPKRLSVAKGKQDGDNRAEVLRLPVVEDEKDLKKPVPRLIARRATGPITVDGKLDEPDWSAAQPTGPFVNTMKGTEGAFAATARVLYGAEHIYVAFEVKDDYLKSTFDKGDDHLWEQDTVEVMFDPDGDGKNYFEIQVAPSGLVFDTAYDARRDPKPFGKTDWTSRTEAGVEVDGTLNDADADQGYTVEMAVPWAALGTVAAPATPPAAGAAWHVNFFVMDAREKGQRAVGWSPPLVGDFHTLDRFGRVVFPQAASGEAAQTGAPSPSEATGQPPQPATGDTAPGPAPAPAKEERPSAPAKQGATEQGSSTATAQGQ
jgi:hypothetical protein